MQPTIVSTETFTRPIKAIVQRRYGSAATLSLSEVERPDTAADEVLIEVAAAGVDRGVWHLLTGRPYLVRLAGYGITKPKIPVRGLDVSGRVVAYRLEEAPEAIADLEAGWAGASR